MNIFLRRIPANTKHIEISEFVSPVLNNGFFKKPSRILNIEILALRDVRLDSIEYHGLVTLDSEWAVKKAVEGLKNRRLNGRYVLVRPYHHRSWNNDPRQRTSNPDENAGFMEKRRGDRRRGKFLEVIKNVTDHFNTEDEFYKTVNHQQIQVTFIVPATIEMKVAECLVKFELEKSAAMADSGETEDFRITRFLTEMEGPEKKTRRFQIFTTRPVQAALLEHITKEFSGGDIHYWITPVTEFGVI
ncbi:MAG: DUF3240 family protein [Methylomonas sp.]|nr:DUF3240 family protein [Methylomonas sp.]